MSLDPDDKQWLDRKAREERVTMTELVRQAVRLYRAEHESPRAPVEKLLRKTSGLWRKSDGLEYQRASRAEWENTG